MKRVFLKLLLLIVTISCGWGNAFGTIDSSIMKIYTFRPYIENLDDLSTELKNFTGIDFPVESLSGIQEQVNRLDEIDHKLSLVGGYNFLSAIPLAHKNIFEYASNQQQDPKHLLFYFHYQKGAETKSSFRIDIKNPDLTPNQVPGIEQYVLTQTQAFYEQESNPLKTLDAIAFGGISAYFSLATGTGEEAPILDEYAEGGNVEGDAFYKIKDAEAFISHSGVPIYLPGGSRVNFYPIDHPSWAGLLRQFKLPNDNACYTPWKWTGSSTYSGYFSGYGYEERPTSAVQEGPRKVIKYSYELYVGQGNNEPPYEVNEKVTIYLGYIEDNCAENASGSSSKFILKKKKYNVPKLDITAEESFNISNIPKYICSNTLIESFENEIASYVLSEIIMWDSHSSEIVSVEDNGNPHNVIQSYPCWVDNIIPASFDQLSIEGFVVFQWEETGQWGHMFQYKGNFYLAYTDNDADYVQLYYDYYYGWVPAKINHESYTAGLVEALSWCAQTVGTYVGYGTFIGVNVMIGNFAGAQFGIYAAFAVDVGFAAGEGVFVYATTGNAYTAIQGFVISTAAAGFGTMLEEGISTYRALKATASPGKKANAVIRMVNSETGLIVEKNLDEFISAVKNELSLADNVVDDLLEDMGLSEDLARYLLKDSKRVKAWEVVREFPTFSTQVDKLAILERVSPRFRYNGLEGFEALKGVFTSSASKQKLFDNLAYLLDNFPDHPSVKFSAIQAGEVKMVSEAGTEIARVIDQGPVLKKFEVSGTAIGGPIDGFQLVDNGGALGYKVSDPTTNVLGTNFDEFLESVTNDFDASIAYTHEAFYYFKNQRWQSLEDLFTTNNLNGGWPPSRGGFNQESVTFLVGQKFDRYQEKIFNHVIVNGIEVPEMGGTFTSPILATPYPYPSRALKPTENANALYYEIEILTPLTFGGTNSDVIPWFGKPGLAKQVEFKIPKDPSTGRPIPWTQLAADGKVKITIHSSPNGSEIAYEGIVIHVDP